MAPKNHGDVFQAKILETLSPQTFQSELKQLDIRQKHIANLIILFYFLKQDSNDSELEE